MIGITIVTRSACLGLLTRPLTLSRSSGSPSCTLCGSARNHRVQIGLVLTMVSQWFPVRFIDTLDSRSAPVLAEHLELPLFTASERGTAARSRCCCSGGARVTATGSIPLCQFGSPRSEGLLRSDTYRTSLKLLYRYQSREIMVPTARPSGEHDTVAGIIDAFRDV